MDGYLSGRDYSYDQIGHTDPYWNIDRERYSVNPAEIKNINTPVNTHIYKISNEQNSINQKCQELILDARNNKDEMRKLKYQLEKLTKKQIPKKSESFFGGINNYNDNMSLIYLLIFIVVIFIILQIQIKQTDNMIKLLIIHLSDKKSS